MIHRVSLLSGSLRKCSTNTGLLRAIVGLNHPSFSFEWIDISKFPVFNEQIQALCIPQPVKLARTQVYNSDAILFGVAQYNFTISSPLKNAYDWLSRGYPKSEADKVSPLKQKISGMVSSGGSMGGVRAQKHLRDSGAFCQLNLMQTNEQNAITIKRFSGNFFDENGNLTDKQTSQKLSAFLNSFDKWIKQNKS